MTNTGSWLYMPSGLHRSLRRATRIDVQVSRHSRVWVTVFLTVWGVYVMSIEQRNEDSAWIYNPSENKLLMIPSDSNIVIVE